MPMQFHFGFYSSLLLVFQVHLLVYSGLCFRRYTKYRYASDGWLGTFLLLSFLYVCPWMLGFAGWYDTQPYRDVLFYTPFQHLFLMGPVMLFYVVNLLNPGFRFRKKHIAHFIPGLVYTLYVLSMFIYDKYIYKGYYFLQDGEDRDFDNWYQVSGMSGMLFYFTAALHFYRSYRRLTSRYLSNADAFRFVWVRNFLIAVLLIVTAWLGLKAYSLFSSGADYAENWWYFLFFALLNYYIAIEGYMNPTRSTLYFKGWADDSFYDVGVLSQRQVLMEAQVSPVLPDSVYHVHDPVKSEQSDEDFQAEIAELDRQMKSEKWYENSEFSLPEMARYTRMDVHYLSRLINKGKKLNFNDYVNKYRIEALTEKLKNGEHKTSTLLGLAIDCGFNSKATFNRAFKKHMGITPGEFITRLAL